MKIALLLIAFSWAIVLPQKVAASYEMSEKDLQRAMTQFAKENGGYDVARRICDHYCYSTDDSLRAILWLRLCAGTGNPVACEELSNVFMNTQSIGIVEWLDRCRSLHFSEFEISIGLPERMDRSFSECDGVILQSSNLVKDAENGGRVRHVGYWIRRPQLAACSQNRSPSVIAISGPVEKTREMLSDPLFLAWVDENRFSVVARRDKYEVASRNDFEKGLHMIARRFDLEGPVIIMELDSKIEFKRQKSTQVSNVVHHVITPGHAFPAVNASGVNVSH